MNINLITRTLLESGIQVVGSAGASVNVIGDPFAVTRALAEHGVDNFNVLSVISVSRGQTSISVTVTGGDIKKEMVVIDSATGEISRPARRPKATTGETLLFRIKHGRLMDRLEGMLQKIKRLVAIKPGTKTQTAYTRFHRTTLQYFGFQCIGKTFIMPEKIPGKLQEVIAAINDKLAT